VEGLKAEDIFPRRVRLRQTKCLNNVVEQDHRTVKKRTWLAKGYGSFSTARRTLQEIEAAHMIRKGRVRWVAKGDATTLASLRVLARSANPDQPGGSPDELRFLGAFFRAGDKASVKTEPDRRDLEGILASIREARRQSDWVMVSIHAHEGAPDDREKPAEFLVSFAHAAIDAGADLFVGHGPHVLRGIEVYKGKPIFYSLANFIFENDLVQFQPQENYDQFSLPLTATPADFYDARSGKDTREFPADQKFWESIVAGAVFNNKHELTGIELQPIVLGFGNGRIRIADALYQRRATRRRRSWIGSRSCHLPLVQKWLWRTEKESLQFTRETKPPPIEWPNPRSSRTTTKLLL
jgi:hypothetical protein